MQRVRHVVKGPILRVFPLFTRPDRCRVKRYPVDPGRSFRISPEIRDGAPELQRYLLEKVFLVRRRECESAYDLEQDSPVLAEPVIEDSFLPVIIHRVSMA